MLLFWDTHTTRNSLYGVLQTGSLWIRRNKKLLSGEVKSHPPFTQTPPWPHKPMSKESGEVRVPSQPLMLCCIQHTSAPGSEEMPIACRHYMPPGSEAGTGTKWHSLLWEMRQPTASTSTPTSKWHSAQAYTHTHHFFATHTNSMAVFYDHSSQGNYGGFPCPQLPQTYGRWQFSWQLSTTASQNTGLSPDCSAFTAQPHTPLLCNPYFSG